MSQHTIYDMEGNLGEPGGLSPAGVRARLMREVAKYGAVHAWCAAHGLKATSQVYEFLNGSRRPGIEILRAMGLEKRYVYVSRKKK